jgi:hypothetical protein
VENLLTEYHTIFGEDRPEHTLEVSKNVRIPTMDICQFHGEVDWVYRVDEKNITPVLFTYPSINPAAGIGMALSNMHIRS